MTSKFLKNIKTPSEALKGKMKKMSSKNSSFLTNLMEKSNLSS